MRAFAKYGIWTVILLLALACKRENNPDIIQDGTGSLVLNLGYPPRPGRRRMVTR